MTVLIIDSQQLYLDGVRQLIVQNGFDQPTALLLTSKPAPAIPHTEYQATIVGICGRWLGPALDLLEALGSRTGTRMCILSDGCADQIGSVVAAGFDALVHRGVGHSQFVTALNTALEGGRYVDETIGAWLLSLRQCPWTPFGLTVREQQIAEMLVRQRSIGEIATAIGVSQHTVKFHVRNVYRKTGVHSRLEMVSLAHAFAEPGSAPS